MCRYRVNQEVDASKSVVPSESQADSNPDTDKPTDSEPNSSVERSK